MSDENIMKFFLSALDKAILIMKETGRDMSDKYKEISKGGLTVNITEC